MARNYLARTGALLAAIAALTLSGPASASINIGTTDASDGTFNPTADVQVDLSQAVTGTWSDNNAANAGKGVYDPVKWAVVFKYSSVNIPAGVTVTFKNHPSGAPVVWLVQGDATIAGTVNLDGTNGGSLGILTESGPGGFQGGAGVTPSHPLGSGHGPGGGGQPTSGPFYSVGGSYVGQGGAANGWGVPGVAYGNAAVLPLIGGSGGTGYVSTGDGGAGGGVLLLCAGTTANLSGSGTISARGGEGYQGHGGGGSGGAIRIIADTVTGGGALLAPGGGLTATGGTGSPGRILIECNTLSYWGSPVPTAVTGIPAVPNPIIWPAATVPTITVAQIAGGAAPSDPHAVLDTSDHYATVDVSPVTPITVRLNATNVPLTWNVILRVVPTYGKDFNVIATKVSGDATASVWEATITAAQGVSAIQARASKP